MRYSLPGPVSQLFAVGLLATFGLQIPSAKAWEFGAADSSAVARPVSSHSVAAAQRNGWSASEEPDIGHRGAKRYFVEFRARNAASYGHMYVMYGEVNDRHEIIKSQVAGFFPAGDRRDCINCSVYYWTVGHVLPVPSEIGASDGDLEEQYVLARFRVWIDADQYKRLVAYINERKAHKGPWNAFVNNCVTFGRDVAMFLNLKAPPLISIAPAVVMYPKDVVEALREANGVHKEQAPLKDAPGPLPAELSPKPEGREAAKESLSSENRLANHRDEEKTGSSTVH